MRNLPKLIPLAFPLFRRHAGLITGCVVGLVAGLGVFGLILGGLIGYLVDELRARMSGWKRIDRFFRTSDRTGIDDRSVWLASVTALTGAVLMKRTHGSVRRFERELLKERIACAFELSPPERQAVDHFVARLFQVGAPAVASICGKLVAVTNGEEEREAVVLLLYRVAAGESERIDRAQDELIRSISVALGVSPERFNVMREAGVPTDDEAYRILGVRRSAQIDEIKRVYRRLATQFHPDSGGELDEERRRQTEEAFIRIQNAYRQIISDRTGRRKTDENGTGSTP